MGVVCCVCYYHDSSSHELTGKYNQHWFFPLYLSLLRYLIAVFVIIMTLLLTNLLVSTTNSGSLLCNNNNNKYLDMESSLDARTKFLEVI